MKGYSRPQLGVQGGERKRKGALGGGVVAGGRCTGFDERNEFPGFGRFRFFALRNDLVTGTYALDNVSVTGKPLRPPYLSVMKLPTTFSPAALPGRWSKPRARHDKTAKTEAIR